MIPELVWRASGNAAGPGGHAHPLDGASRPANFQRFDFFLSADDDVAGILRPIAAAKPNLAGRTLLAAAQHRANNGANGLRVGLRALQMHTQARMRARISIELRRIAVLPDREIRSSVMVKIAKRGPSGFTVNGKAALARRHSDEAAMPVA